jgi:hypothetical protein
MTGGAAVSQNVQHWLGWIASSYPDATHNDVRRTDAKPTATMWSTGNIDEKSRPMSDLNTIISTYTADHGDNGVASSAPESTESDIANILIVEHDEDCADALEAILADLPGIATVQTAGTAGAAFDLLDDGSYDVVGFGMLACAVATEPDVIFIGAHQPDTFTTGDALAETVAAFRERVPGASIILLCVYPNQYRDAVGDLVDGCVRKDTSARELRELIDGLRASRSSHS